MNKRTAPSPARHCISRVLFGRAGVEMLGIYARAHVACVVNLLTWWYRAVRQQIRDAMGANGTTTADRYFAVTVIPNAAEPKPTFVRFFDRDLFPKSYLDIYSAPAFVAFSGTESNATFSRIASFRYEALLAVFASSHNTRGFRLRNPAASEGAEFRRYRAFVTDEWQPALLTGVGRGHFGLRRSEA